MIILYYSRRTAFPALLASLKHCHPTPLTGAGLAAGSSLAAAILPCGRAALFSKALRRISRRRYPLPDDSRRAAAGDQANLKRPGRAAQEPPRPGLVSAGRRFAAVPRKGGDRSAAPSRKAAFWMEIEAFVEQTRLQGRAN